MADTKEYRIRIQGTLVEVTKEIYLTYYRMARQARGVSERDKRNGVVLYSELDTKEQLAVEMFADKDAIQTEDQAVTHIMSEKLRTCIQCLSDDEQHILFRRYWCGLSQSELAKEFSTSQQVISYQENRILSKLKKLLNK